MGKNHAIFLIFLASTITCCYPPDVRFDGNHIALKGRYSEKKAVLLELKKGIDPHGLFLLAFHCDPGKFRSEQPSPQECLQTVSLEKNSTCVICLEDPENYYRVYIAQKDSKTGSFTFYNAQAYIDFQPITYKAALQQFRAHPMITLERPHQWTIAQSILAICGASCFGALSFVGLIAESQEKYDAQQRAQRAQQDIANRIHTSAHNQAVFTINDPATQATLTQIAQAIVVTANLKQLVSNPVFAPIKDHPQTIFLVESEPGKMLLQENSYGARKKFLIACQIAIQENSNLKKQSELHSVFERAQEEYNNLDQDEEEIILP